MFLYTHDWLTDALLKMRQNVSGWIDLDTLYFTSLILCIVMYKQSTRNICDNYY